MFVLGVYVCVPSFFKLFFLLLDVSIPLFIPVSITCGFCYFIAISRFLVPRPRSFLLRVHCLQLLAVGWVDGQVSTWNVMESLQENASTCACSNQGVHKQPITVVLWNPSGTRLVTGDKVRSHLSPDKILSRTSTSALFMFLYPRC